MPRELEVCLRIRFLAQSPFRATSMLVSERTVSGHTGGGPTLPICSPPPFHLPCTHTCAQKVAHIMPTCPMRARTRSDNLETRTRETPETLRKSMHWEHPLWRHTRGHCACVLRLGTRCPFTNRWCWEAGELCAIDVGYLRLHDGSVAHRAHVGARRPDRLRARFSVQTIWRAEGLPFRQCCMSHSHMCGRSTHPSISRGEYIHSRCSICLRSLRRACICWKLEIRGECTHQMRNRDQFGGMDGKPSIVLRPVHDDGLRDSALRKSQ